jgi:hypothetical protein
LALLVCELDSTIFILHLVPENDIIERFGQRGATEQMREQIGTITLHVGDGATTTGFLNNLERLAARCRSASKSASRIMVVQLATSGFLQYALRFRTTWTLPATMRVMRVNRYDNQPYIYTDQLPLFLQLANYKLPSS